METKKNKRTVEDIDETFLLNSIAEHGITKEPAKPEIEVAGREKAEPVPEPLPEKPKETKEPAKRRRNPSCEDYGSRFFERNEFKTRQCVYISRKIHTTISKIVKILSDRDITVGGYIDSILMEHLEAHKEEIIELYNKELSKNNSNSLMDF